MSLYKYSAQEASNLLIGQNGFDVIAAHDTNYSNPSSSNHSWIAIQSLLSTPEQRPLPIQNWR